MSALNDGTILGFFTGALALYTNNAGTTSQYIGYKFDVNNNNALAGYFGQAVGLLCDTTGETGSAITKKSCVENKDLSATILTAGGVTIGSFSNTPATAQLFIVGARDTSSTFPLFVKSLSLHNLLYVDNAGNLNANYAGSQATFNAVNATVYKINGTIGSTCSGAPTASFASSNGIITHC